MFTVRKMSVLFFMASPLSWRTDPSLPEFGSHSLRQTDVFRQCFLGSSIAFRLVGVLQAPAQTNCVVSVVCPFRKSVMSYLRALKHWGVVMVGCYIYVSCIMQSHKLHCWLLNKGSGLHWNSPLKVYINIFKKNICHRLLTASINTFYVLPFTLN